MENTPAASPSRRSFLSRILTRRPNRKAPVQDEKGPFGLNTLSVPAQDVIADLIFVHGLGGGSRSTWTKGNDPLLYWPEKWLPKDDGFRDVRIHSFGYDSNWGKESVLNIHDFAKSLLSCVQDCPLIPKGASTPIVFIGHSMGGLVIKRSFILANQKKEFIPLSRRVQTIIFLATPHRGSDLAQLFSKLLKLSSGNRPFVADLHRNSLATQAINDEFPHYCEDLRLYSFYETLPTSLGITKSLIVEKDLATMGYAHERTSLINANHRGICKFDNSSDPNYLIVRNALASTLEICRDNSIGLVRKHDEDKQMLLVKSLGTPVNVEEEFLRIDNLRILGSCEWLISEQSFQEWQETHGPNIYWLHARPATGKTILSARVIAHLKRLRKDCVFYFFDFRDGTKSTISSFLLSIAWQISSIYPQILSLVLDICQKNKELNKADYRSIWRKLYVDGILEVEFSRPLYWVVDAIDECKAGAELTTLLLEIREKYHMRVFVTSRNAFESRQKSILTPKFVVREISLKNTMHDITMYLEAYLHELPSVGDNGRQTIMSEILQRSSGSFLWVRLVIQELRQIHTSAEIRLVLETVPSGLNDVYSRILESMTDSHYGKHLAQTLLKWTVFAARPMLMDELHQAVQIDLDDAIDNIERSIVSSCGQLIYIDSKSRVQITHLTVRDFLLSVDATSEFSIDEQNSHTELALTCLKYLNGEEMQDKFLPKVRMIDTTKERSPFAHYACTCLLHHLVSLSSMTEELILALAQLLSSSNLLVWIEYIGLHADLNILIQMGSILQKHSNIAKTSTSPSREIALIDGWAIDLTRLVTAFGNKLSISPTSIFHLVPPFCPAETNLHRQFGSSLRGLRISGHSTTTWSDCLSTIVDPQQQFLALACSKDGFAVGMSTGKIIIYDQKTCQELFVCRHHERVKVLCFSHNEKILGSAGPRMVQLWDVSTGKELNKFEILQECIMLAFVNDDKLLLGALKNNRLVYWDLDSGSMKRSSDWTEGLEANQSQAFRWPIFATLSLEMNLLAIVYRGRDVLIWDLEQETQFAIYDKEGAVGLGANSGSPFTAGAICVVFSTAPDVSLMAVAHADGDLVLFDILQGQAKATVTANSQVLACSPSGRILASEDSSGIIQLFEFMTLKLLYCIESEDYGVRDLAFSGDERYLLDIRGSQCQIWNPVLLLSWNLDEQHTNTELISVTQQERKSEDSVLITSVVCHTNGEYLFVGKKDGSVYVYRTESGLQDQKLFSHGRGVSILSLTFDDERGILVSVDNASSVMVHEVHVEEKSWVAKAAIFNHRVDKSVYQVLIHPESSRLLISTRYLDTLWSISPDKSYIVETAVWENRESCQWSIHPQRRDQLLLVMGSTVHIYDWLTLRRLSENDGVLLGASILTGLEIHSTSACFAQDSIATGFSIPSKPQSVSKLLIWDATDFAESSTTATPVSTYIHVSDRVKYLVGNYGKRLIFLDKDGWICSIRPHSTSFSRHFFFPADWLAMNVELMISVTSNGDIVFVKRDEIAVIKRGLVADFEVIDDCSV
ncbi:hypothetical protein PVAG01_09717 [Phlyctema vagabunda]|uniref:GPI inositol-deacylase n=1 Tax=Phlyctema vagabunda TaxID=108571 RepID=A0ABR4P859_9HELO